jgi:hypothetical protein
MSTRFFTSCDRVTAVLPPARPDGSGQMIVSLQYDETAPLNQLPAEEAKMATYRGSIRIDGERVFTIDRLDIPLELDPGFDVDEYRDAIDKAVFLGSSYPGSGHHLVKNTNEKAPQYADVWEFARKTLNQKYAKEIKTERSVREIAFYVGER